MKRYSDYISIDQDFTPVYSETKDRWKSFIPHDAFAQLLEQTLKGMETGRPPWIQGPYGTGKTYAAFTLKHIFEDDIDEVKAYFDRHDALSKHWGRFKAARDRGPILVIYYNSTSDDHANTLALLYSLQQSIRKEILRKGLQDAAEESLARKMLDCAANLDWSILFPKYIEKFPGIRDAQGLLEELKGNPSTDLLLTVADILEQTNVIFRKNPEELKQWCNLLIRKNNLGGLFVICDEFSDYIRSNSHLNDLQNMSSNGDDSGFLFMPITHRTLAQSISDDDVDKIRERYELVEFGMQYLTAFRLLGNCLSVRHGREIEWNKERQPLWESVHELADIFEIEGDDARNDIESLLPMHPFTAMLLSKISNSYMSSQRTMFRFVAAEFKDEEAPFQKFLHTTLNGEFGKLLTPDELLPFFFFEKTSDLGEFKTIAPALINQYRQRLSSVPEGLPQKLYATIILLQILHRMSQHSKFEAPYESILRKCYLGSVEHDDFDCALKALEDAHVFSIINRGKDREFVAPDSNIDSERLDVLRKNYANKSLFQCDTELALGKYIREEFKPLNHVQEQQMGVAFTTFAELKIRRDAMLRSASETKLLFVFVVCQNDIEINEANRFCAAVTSERKDVAFVVFQIPFSDALFFELKEGLAYAEYYKEANNLPNREAEQQKIQAHVKRWIEEAKLSEPVVVYDNFSDKKYSHDSTLNKMHACLLLAFPHGLLKFAANLTTLCQVKGTGPNAASIVLGRSQPSYQHEWLLNYFNSLEQQPESDGIKIIIDHIRSKFDNGGDVYPAELWAELRRAPYGLYQCNASVMIIAFAMSNYVESWYHYDEANNNQTLNASVLANLASNMVKGYAKDKERLRTMSEQDIIFCDFVRHALELPETKACFPTDALMELTNWLRECVGYPLCGLEEVGSYRGEDMIGSTLEGIQLLGRLLRDNANDLNSANLHRDLSALLGKYSSLENSLCTILRADAFKQGLLRMTERCAPDLAIGISENAINIEWVRDRLYEKMKQEYRLWEAKEVEEKFAEVEADFLLREALNDYLGTHIVTIADINKRLYNELSEFKVPAFIYIDQFGDSSGAVGDFFEFIRDTNSLLPHAKRELAHFVVQHKLRLRALFNSPSELLRLWASKNQEHSFSGEEIALFIGSESAGLSLFSTDEALSNSLRRYLSSSKIKRLHNIFKKLFLDIFGAETPEIWSKSRCVPLDLVWELSEGDKVLAIFDACYEQTEALLASAISVLDDNKNELEALNNEALVHQRFVQKIAPEFSGLRADNTAIHQLNALLLERLGEPVLAWSRHALLPLIMRTWGEEHYIQHIKPQLLTWLASQPLEASATLLAELLEEPGCGLVIHQRKCNG